jgi:hypothetical protein
VKFEKHEGGAIREGDRVKLIEEPVVHMPDPVNRSVQPYPESIPSEYNSRVVSAEWNSVTPHGLPSDMSYQANHTGWDTIPPLFVGEEEILKDLIRMTPETGIENHHPAVAQVVYQSLAPYPELAHAYLNS